MKKSKIYLAVLVLFTATALLSSCRTNEDKKTDSTEQVSDKSGPEYTSAYVCPMHCEGSGSDSAGTCPVCDMDYVKNTNHNYACPMHPEITGIEGDTCSKCGMDLTPLTGDDHTGHNH